ncbi:mgtA regulatory leader peptide MgtL [Superficieibacter sp.]
MDPDPTPLPRWSAFNVR